jgi:hypothetical protein
MADLNFPVPTAKETLDIGGYAISILSDLSIKISQVLQVKNKEISRLTTELDNVLQAFKQVEFQVTAILQSKDTKIQKLTTDLQNAKRELQEATAQERQKRNIEKTDERYERLQNVIGKLESNSVDLEKHKLQLEEISKKLQEDPYNETFLTKELDLKADIRNLVYVPPPAIQILKDVLNSPGDLAIDLAMKEVGQDPPRYESIKVGKLKLNFGGIPKI